MRPIGEGHPLKRFFRGLIDNVFAAEMGVCSPALSDYLSDLLIDFIHVDRLRAIRDAEGRPLDQVAEMLAVLVEAEAEYGDESIVRLSEDRRWQIYRHIGDYSLFWTGVYPEGLRGRRTRQSKDRLLDYVHQGKRSYALASELTHEDSIPPPALLRQLSEHFEACAHGLVLVRKEWEHEPPPTFEQTGTILY